MTEPTQKELNIWRAKSKIFDMIKERETLLLKANELQANIQKCDAEIVKMETELRNSKIEEVK